MLWFLFLYLQNLHCYIGELAGHKNQLQTNKKIYIYILILNMAKAIICTLVLKLIPQHYFASQISLPYSLTPPAQLLGQNVVENKIYNLFCVHSKIVFMFCCCIKKENNVFCFFFFSWYNQFYGVYIIFYLLPK